MGKILNLSQILNAPKLDLEREVVAMPEWGGDIIVQAFDGTQLERINKLQAAESRRANGRVGEKRSIRAAIIIEGVVNEDGSPVFSRRQESWLVEQPVRVTNRIIEALTRLNGGDEFELEDETEKNSEATSGNDSYTN